MSPALDRLRTEVALLDEKERAQLALDLLESLDPSVPDPRESAAEIEAAWNAEITRRVEAFDRGEMSTISAEELHRDDPRPIAR